MARHRVVWNRRSPKRAAGRLGWTAFVSMLVVGGTWLIFGDEPGTAADGAVNPLALVMPVIGVLFGVALVPQVIALVRRPVVSADHYALTVRPGVGRTLVLPWAEMAEVATMSIDEDAFLLVRCRPQRVRTADWPRWWDQAHLRAAKRGAPAASAYDLAVPMADFDGTPDSLLEELAVYAPPHVTVASRAPR